MLSLRIGKTVESDVRVARRALEVGGAYCRANVRLNLQSGKYVSERPTPRSYRVLYRWEPLGLLHSPHCGAPELEEKIFPRRLSQSHTGRRRVPSVRTTDREPIFGHGQPAARLTIALCCLASLPIGPAFFETRHAHCCPPSRVSSRRGMRVGHILNFHGYLSTIIAVKP